MGLSRSYGGSAVDRLSFLADEWQQLQLVQIGGKWLYRKTEPQPKCKRCRNMNGRVGKRRRGYHRQGVRYAVAPSKGECCPSCGNPFMYFERESRSNVNFTHCIRGH